MNHVMILSKPKPSNIMLALMFFKFIRCVVKDFYQKGKRFPIKIIWEPFSTGIFFLIPKKFLTKNFFRPKFFSNQKFWDQEKGSRGKRFPYYFNWEPFSFLIEIFYNSPNKFEKHQCEHIIRGFGFIMYHNAVHMCLQDQQKVLKRKMFPIKKQGNLFPREPFPSTNNFWSKKILVGKKFWSKKILFQNNFVQKQFCSKKIFGWNKILA